MDRLLFDDPGCPLALEVSEVIGGVRFAFLDGSRIAALYVLTDTQVNLLATALLRRQLDRAVAHRV